MAEPVFWGSILLIAYSYVLYPLVLLGAAAAVQLVRDIRFLVWRQAERRLRPIDAPMVTLLVAAHNEERWIADKVRDTLALDYPADRIEVLIGSDGSTDATEARARASGDPRVRVVAFPDRRGKSAVLNDLIPKARGELVVLSDANTRLEPHALWMLVRHFADPTVGAVCGELRLQPSPVAGKAEALYWRYEMGLKFLENRLGAVLGANGGIYAIRRDRFVPFPPATIVDDFVIPMQIRAAGWRVMYDPEALATEEVAPTLEAEFRRKVRIGAGDLQCLALTWRLLLPRYGFTALAFWSHKILRWSVPISMLVALGSNMLLADRPVYLALLVGQAALYLAAFVAHTLPRRRAWGVVLMVPYYFAVMNLALLLGFVRFVTGGQRVTWERAGR